MNQTLVYQVNGPRGVAHLELPLFINFVPAIGTGILPPGRHEQDTVKKDATDLPKTDVRMPALFTIRRIGYQVEQRILRLYAWQVCATEDEQQKLIEQLIQTYGFTLYQRILSNEE